MSSSAITLPKRNAWNVFATTISLTGWYLSQTWRMLVVITLGIMTTVILVCSVPLFSEVATSAGLRDVFSATPGTPGLGISVAIPNPSPPLFQQLSQQATTLVHHDISQYAHDKPLRAIQMPELAILPDQLPAINSSITPSQVLLNGYDLQDLSSHLTLVAGRLPDVDGQFIETVVTQPTLDKMGLHLGSTINTQFRQNLVGPDALLVPVRIVGVITLRFPKETLWFHSNFQTANTFQPQPYGSSFLFPVMTSNATLLAFFEKNHPHNISNGFFFYWIFPLDVAQLDSNNLNSITAQYKALNDDLFSSLVVPSSVGGQILEWPLSFGPLSEDLPTYSGHILVIEWLATALLLMILGLVLFFVSMMAELLIDRQGTAIATLRSRGAQQKQIFAIFTTQGLLSALLALIIGSFLSIVLVHFIVHIVLPTQAQKALNTIEDDPLATTLRTGWFALVATAGSLLTLILAIRRAAQINIVTLRRQTARSTKKSLWQRLYLDILFPILVLSGYFVYSFTLSLPDAAEGGKPIYTTALTLVAALLMLIAVIVFFQRLFPFMLRGGTALATHGRGASATLALAQIERSPRAASRMIILLALAVAFATFTLIFISSLQQHTIDSIDYQAGADFSGDLLTTSSPQTLADQTALYQHIPGVTSAAIGYKTTIVQDNAGGIAVHILAADADTFAQSVLWKPAYSRQSLTSLMQLLTTHRTATSQSHVVYAVVDDQMAHFYRLTPDSSFILKLPGSSQTLQFQVVAIIAHLPGVYNEPPGNPGMLLDYQSYATVYTQSTQQPLTQNYIWLQTHSDANSLAQVRQALTTRPLQLGSLQDRRTMLGKTQNNLLLIDLQSILNIAATTALLLALLGIIIATWSDTAMRLSHFVVLRALGMATRQIAAVFLWEQAIIYSSAILLGTLLGSMLTTLIPPLLTITSEISPFVNPNALNTPPIQIAVSIPQLLLMLCMVAAICTISLGIMVTYVSRPSPAQILRLNED